MKKIKEQYLKELNKAFGDFKFYEDGHYYTYKDKPIEIGVTGLIGQYENEFESEIIAQRVADKNGVSVQSILDEWNYKNAFARHKGTNGHNFAQSLWSDKEYQLIQFDLSESFKTANKSIFKQAKQFYNDFKDKLVHLADEFVIGSWEYDIASAIDHLFINKITGELIIVDYKTNSDIHKNERYAKKMKVPLSHLKDTTLNHYAIQLSFYKYLIEKYTNLKVNEFFIVWFSELNENYEIVEVPYLKNEVIKILELRRCKRMSKMIMIMGEPATGKTVSLQSLPKEELYYIDCDKKGLNYKGWKNDFNEEKKNFCRTNDGEKIITLLKGISEKRKDIKYIAIDTINSIMIADEMRRSKEKNYDKWVDLASCIFNLIDVVPDLRDDITVIFIGHTQTDDEGFTRLLTNGKKLNKIGLEKYFDTVLITKNIDGKYKFEISSPTSTARVPMGAFENEQYIDNNLYEIIKELKEY